MDDIGFVVTVNSRCDFNFRAVGSDEYTRVAGLATGGCVKNGSVNDDTARIR
jgi:sigma54-dependent transcription regulator